MQQPKLLQQEAQKYLLEYRKYQNDLSANQLQDILNSSLELFFNYYDSTGSSLREVIELICEANFSPNSEFTRIGLEALFPNLIEKLNDSFSCKSAFLYDRIIAQVIAYARQQSGANTFDYNLRQYGLSTEASILARRRSLNQSKIRIPPDRPLKRIFSLSRVTIGADIAVTSVILNHFRRQFPTAEFFLLGSPKLAEIFGGDPRIKILSVNYGRGGKLLSRFAAWIEVIKTIQNDIIDLSPSEFLVIDPDSRLTQLGMLPVLPSSIESNSYIFFPSRSYSFPGIQKIGQLAAHWISTVCPFGELSTPFVSLHDDHSSFGNSLVSKLQGSNPLPVICISFGVGGNSRKRISEEFEVKLVQILSQRGILIIDSGASPSELDQVVSIQKGLFSIGKKILSINQSDDVSALTIPDGVEAIFWKGGVGSFASLISASNLYIGYDSAGQHLAAALKVPTLTIFVNSGTNLFPLRWQPHGEGAIETINLPSKFSINSENALSTVIDLVVKTQGKLIIK